MFIDEIGTRLLFFDGGMGTQLQARGLKGGELPESWNLSHPEDVRAIHTAYLEAGADVATANTFGANAIKMQPAMADRAVEAGVRLAKEAVCAHGHGYVALDLGPTGKLLEPFGDLAFEDAVSAYARQARLGAQAGADLILIETMSDLYETKAAILGAREGGLPIIATVVFDKHGKLLTGADVETTVTVLESLRVTALGINCGLGPTQMEGLLASLRALCSIPILVQPNAGLPRNDNGRTVYDVDAVGFAAAMKRMAQGGAQMLGGCCGTTPDHIAATVALCRGLAPLPVEKKAFTAVCSRSHTVRLGQEPKLVGERINPTGKPKLKRALREEDIDYILEEADKQIDAGAHILDVNVGLPEIDETALLPKVVQELQTVTDLPLQLDTSDIRAMEAALRIYNGKPLLNSVSGKNESVEAVFPLLKRYGGCVVALTMDEEGIPDTAEKRLAIARKILACAAQYGIEKKDIVFDALTLTISTGAQNAAVTLETLRRIKTELHAATTLGISNVSFGLPAREGMNAAFLTMALQNGLDAAIINPNNGAMLAAYRTARALLGYDPNCEEYIAHAVVEAPAEKAPVQADVSLRQAVEKGLKNAAHAATLEALKSQPPLDIIAAQLLPALDAVGAGFEKGTLFLPQLLMSADAAKEAFDLLRQEMSKSGTVPQTKGKIVLATVKGDVHDIGKNIVKVLLENYGFAVMDLGRDVAPQAIVQAVRERDIRLVGLSALMTTTVRSMEETIRLLHAQVPACKIMVGGAVLNEEYARSIGADFYGKDAMASVGYAQSLFSDEK